MLWNECYEKNIKLIIYWEVREEVLLDLSISQYREDKLLRRIRLTYQKEWQFYPEKKIKCENLRFPDISRSCVRMIMPVFIDIIIWM